MHVHTPNDDSPLWSMLTCSGGMSGELQHRECAKSDRSLLLASGLRVRAGSAVHIHCHREVHPQSTFQAAHTELRTRAVAER